ncbi:hypothetical protein CN354_05925 [Bacillus cereus]|nr:hypothetical protein CN354_05925 [Bacillus cereus]WJE51347.1 hypothetical protein QRE66_18845 [Bacillus cereus]
MVYFVDFLYECNLLHINILYGFVKERGILELFAERAIYLVEKKLYGVEVCCNLSIILRILIEGDWFTIV